jgi:outer membrane protein assembly factor BamB
VGGALLSGERDQVPTAPEPELLVPTFLGNDRRCFYGRGVMGDNLAILDRFKLGSGPTTVGGKTFPWSGAGWTGQPALVRDNGKVYLLQGAYDHHLRKISVETHREVWRYPFDDILKASPTVYFDRDAAPDNRIVVLQGSRIGNGLAVRGSQPCPSFRAVSFRTGKELWRMDVRQTRCYSRDHDGSALDLGDGTVFTCGENSIGCFLDARTAKASKKDGILQPALLGEVKLYNEDDVRPQGNVRGHGGDLLVEGSAARLGNTLYVASGTGRVFGIDIHTRNVVWEYYTGSDLNCTVAISRDDKLFIGIEKQYIPGSGGVMKLDPSKRPGNAVEWFLPTGSVRFAEWEGGVIGSVALNDEYRDPELPALWASHAMDGFLYVGSQHDLSSAKADGPRGEAKYPVPRIAAKFRVGASIATPIFTDGNGIVSAGYGGLRFLTLHYDPTTEDGDGVVRNAKGQRFKVRLDERKSPLRGMTFESTPVVWDGRMYVASRDGNLYTVG